MSDEPEREPDTVRLTAQEEAARKRRNLAIALGLGAFIVLIFLVTVVRLTTGWNAGATG
ncbi:MAG: protoheme IX farnesyltransferase [Oceanicaulis sp.]|nr:protoheme IX farnesyltransferase [Oceanicaulis sp.]